MDGSKPNQELPIAGAGGPSSVPVFDCHVILTPPEGDRKNWTARTANLNGLTATGPTERDTLMAITARFKQTVGEYVQHGTAVPFRDKPESPDPNELERWIPVHL